MTDKIGLFKKELLDALDNLPEGRELSPGDIRVLADIASVYAALREMEEDGRHHEEHAERRAARKDDIADELASAEAKYAEYRKTGDHSLLEMARDELRHANMYINRAAASSDHELLERLPGYREKLHKLERSMGSGTHPIL